MDVQGDLYEYLLMQLTTAGKNGQFRTPRHIIRMIVKLIDPKIGDRVCDPAADTGGFLVNAYEHILEANTSDEVKEYDEEGKPHHLIGDKIADKKLMQFLKSRALTGYDFDTTMSRIGAMNLMLHGIDNPNLRYMDTLSKTFTEKELYEVVLANPPFKGSIDKSDINSRGQLDLSKISHVDLPIEEFESLKLRKGDIIFNRTNSTELVGKTAYWNLDMDAVIASYLVKLRPTKDVKPVWFSYLLNTRYFKTIWNFNLTKSQACKILIEIGLHSS